MKLFIEKILTNDRLFVVKEELFPYNDFPLHIHDEFELILILKSSGERYVGNHIAPFSAGDLCLFGPNLPHTFYNKHLPADREVHQIVIQFKEGFLGEGLFEKTQFSKIKMMLLDSCNGIAFQGTTRDLVSDKMKQMVHADEVEAVSCLLSILNLLSRSSEYQVLSNQKLIPSTIKKDTERMNCVYHYLLDHFKKEISLEEIAAVAHLSTSAFCRYFKKHTRKTLSAFVNELRINYACKLLQKKEMSIREVCFESGFNNVSYFNRQFRIQMAVSPLKYARQI